MQQHYHPGTDCSQSKTDDTDDWPNGLKVQPLATSPAGEVRPSQTEQVASVIVPPNATPPASASPVESAQQLSATNQVVQVMNLKWVWLAILLLPVDY